MIFYVITMLQKLMIAKSTAEKYLLRRQEGNPCF